MLLRTIFSKQLGLLTTNNQFGIRSWLFTQLWQILDVSSLGHFCVLSANIRVKSRFFMRQKKNLDGDGRIPLIFVMLLELIYFAMLPQFNSQWHHCFLSKSLYLFFACWAIILYSISGSIKLCILNKCKQVSTVLLLFRWQSCILKLSYLQYSNLLWYVVGQR